MELPAYNSPMMWQMVITKERQHFGEQTKRLEKELDDAKALCAQSLKHRKKKEEELNRELQRVIAEKDAQIGERDAHIAELESMVANLSTAVSNLRHDLGTVSTKQELSRSSWSKREEALMIDLERKERALQQVSQISDEIQSRLRETDAQQKTKIQMLTERVAQLEKESTDARKKDDARVEMVQLQFQQLSSTRDRDDAYYSAQVLEKDKELQYLRHRVLYLEAEISHISIAEEQGRLALAVQTEKCTRLTHSLQTIQEAMGHGHGLYQPQ